MITLLQRVERFLRRTGMRPTNFGRQAARDPRLVFDLRRGRNPRPTLTRRVDRFLEEQEEPKCKRS